MSPRVLRLADMTVLGEPPAKLAKALAVVATALHPTFARQPWIEHRDKSKESCVLASLAVRDFLVSVDFIDAQVRSVTTVMRAMRGEEVLHSLGIGVPGRLDRSPRHWNGHMVVTAAGFLIDTTLYGSKRNQWSDLPGMLAMPFKQPEQETLYGLRPFAYASLIDDKTDYRFDIVYLDAPSNTSWTGGGDCDPARREAAVAAMHKRFGRWHAKA